MKSLSLSIILLLITINSAFSQITNEENDIKQTINALFDGMRKSDTTLLRSAFSTQAIMQTIAKNRAGKELIKTESIDAFIKSIGQPHPEIYDEHIKFTKILVDANLASVWTDYKFYIGDKFSHCGVNSFQLFKGENGWKIIYLIDTRRKDNCN